MQVASVPSGHSTRTVALAAAPRPKCRAVSLSAPRQEPLLDLLHARPPAVRGDVDRAPIASRLTGRAALQPHREPVVREERFSLVAAAPALIPASTIGVMLLWPVAATRISGLAAGTVAGMVGELIVVSWSLKTRGTTLLPRRAVSSAASRQVVAQYFPLLTGATLMMSEGCVLTGRDGGGYGYRSREASRCKHWR